LKKSPGKYRERKEKRRKVFKSASIQIVHAIRNAMLQMMVNTSIFNVGSIESTNFNSKTKTHTSEETK
jgi:hypothetical protein